MEESLKRLKQARKGATTTTTTGANGGLTDDGKIRLQLALDVEYLGEQVGGDTCTNTHRQTVTNFCNLKYFFNILMLMLCTVVCLRSRRWVFSQVTSPCSPLWWTLWKRPENSLNTTSKKVTDSFTCCTHPCIFWRLVKGKKNRPKSWSGNSYNDQRRNVYEYRDTTETIFNLFIQKHMCLMQTSEPQCKTF